MFSGRVETLVFDKDLVIFQNFDGLLKCNAYVNIKMKLNSNSFCIVKYMQECTKKVDNNAY